MTARQSEKLANLGIDVPANVTVKYLRRRVIAPLTPPSSEPNPVQVL